MRIAEITEAEEKETINKEIGERRTRLGAKLGQVTTDVKREVFSSSPLELLYRDIINWTNDDDLRREYEEKLFRRAYDHLLVLQGDAKDQKRNDVRKMAGDIVIIKHPFLLAWELNLEWADVDEVSELDENILREFIAFFPETGLARVLQAYLGEVMPVKDQTDPKNKGDKGNDDDEQATSTLSAEERLLLFADGLEDSKSSALAHRIVSDYFRRIEEYESCVDVSRAGLTILKDIRRTVGLVLQNSNDAMNTNLATSLVYYQAPKNHPEAEDIFNEILSRKPTATPALLGLGLILEEQEEFEKASQFLKQAHERDPENLRIGTESAWCKVLTGDISGGLAELETYLADLEGTKSLDLKSTTYFRIGRCLWDLKPDRPSRKDRSGAYARFISSLKANPFYAPPYTYLGFFYADYAKDQKRARQCFHKAFELSSSEVQAAERLSRSFADASDWDLVEVIAQRVIDSGIARPAPGSKRKGISWPFSALGIVQMNKQEYPHAVTSFQAALRISPTDYNAWVGLGESYHSSGRYIAAQKTLEHARSLAKDHTEDLLETSWFADYMLANVQRELGDYEAALQGYKSVLAARPDEFGVSIALLQTSVERALHCRETGFFGLATQSAISAISDATSMRQSSPIFGNTFNYWKAVGDALAVLAAVPGHLHILSIGHLQVVRGNEHTWDPKLEEHDKVGLVVFDKMIEEASETSPAALLGCVITAALLAYKHAIIVTALDTHAQAVAWYNLGWMELRASQYLVQLDKPNFRPASLKKTAVLCFKRSIELEAGNADFWNALGIATTTLNPKVAQHSFVRSLHLNERLARTWTNLGVLYLLQEDTSLAHAAFSRAQSTDPDYAHAWVGEGIITLLAGDAHGALSHFTHALEISDSSSVPAKSHFATSTFDTLVSGASEDLDTLVQPVFALQQLGVQSPSNIVYRHMMALLQERLGDMSPALENLAYVCAELEARFEESEDRALLANFIKTKSDQARLQLTASDYPAALENAETVLDLTNERDSSALSMSEHKKVRVSGLLTAGLACFYLKSLDKSIDMFRDALAETNSDPDVVCLLAQVLWAQGGDKEKGIAKDQLFDCIEKHPGHVQATTLIGAMSATDDDEATLDAVMEDLQSLRADSKLSQGQRVQLERLLASLAALLAKSESAIPSEAKTLIMLSPHQPQGWSLLAESSASEEVPDAAVTAMAANTAKQAIPPHGSLRAEQLCHALSRTGLAGDAQKSILVAPWDPQGWESLTSVST